MEEKHIQEEKNIGCSKNGGMGEFLMNKWVKLEKRYKLAFFGTFILGMLIHMYMVTNKLPNHDYVYNIYSDQFYWPLSLGRWFLNYIARLSSNFALPWLNGLLSILYVSITAAIIVAVLELKRTIPILLCGGLLVAYPAFTDTIAYIFTADGYMFAMMLAALSVWFWNKNKRGYIVVSAVCLALSTGIYQAYISFAIILILIRIIIDIFEKRYSNKDLLIKIGKACICGLLGMLIYYIGLQLTLNIYHTELAGYMGVNKVSAPNIKTIISVLLNDTIALGEMFIGGNSDFSVYEKLNIIFILLFIASYIIIYFKQKLYHRKLQSILLVVASLLFIPGAYILDFLSEEVVYLFRMQYCLVLTYMLLIKLADEYLMRWLSETVMILMIVIISNFAIIANISYFNMELCWEQTYATAIQMQIRIYDLKEYEDGEKIAIIGYLDSDDREWVLNKIPYILGVSDTNIMKNENSIISILNNDFGMKLEPISEEQKASILETSEYSSMPCWPSRESVQMINDVIVIKLSE